MNSNALRSKLQAAVAALSSAGYTHSHSVCDDSGTGGMVFIKTHEDGSYTTFVLNIDTMDNLPNA